MPGDDPSVRVAVVGAGLAGLATAAGLHRLGHDVTVVERGPELRSSGLALNLWSNATSLLPSLGVPAASIPGDPFSCMVLRAAGRQVARIDLPARGLPHVNVDRGDLLNALAAALPASTITFGARCSDVHDLAREHDLVVVADGANSALRSQVIERPRRRWSWTLWQACVEAEVPELPAGTGAGITRAGMFSGIWRLPRGRVTWFVEQPARPSGTGAALLEELREDEDPVLRELAAATPPDEWIEWRAEDLWPPRSLHDKNVVLVGDAAHAMLPTLGQGACQSLEDAAVLATAIQHESDVGAALRRYEKTRVPRVRRIIALARAGAISRRPGIATRAAPSVASARLMAATSGPILRRLANPIVAPSDLTCRPREPRATEPGRVGTISDMVETMAVTDAPRSRRMQRAIEKYVSNPGMRLALRAGVAPRTFALLETTGNKTGRRRLTPIGNGLDGDTFWLVSELGLRSGYARNIQANPEVRVKVGRRWHSGIATFLPDDDGWKRREEIDRRNGLMGKFDGKIFRASATTPVTIRIDLGAPPSQTSN